MLTQQLKAQQTEFMVQIEELKTKKAQRPSIEPRSTQIVRIDGNWGGEKSKSAQQRQTNYTLDGADEIKVSTFTSRVHHDITQRFKKRENKYGGTDDEYFF